MEVLVLSIYCVLMLVVFVGLGFFESDEELTHMDQTDEPYNPSWR